MGFFDFLRPAQRSKTKAPGENNRLVVIPVDETKQSLHALEWAIGNVYKQETDQLHLLSVVPRVAGPYPAEVQMTNHKQNDVQLLVPIAHTQHMLLLAVTAPAADLSCSWT
jgi:hypothetical protein